MWNRGGLAEDKPPPYASNVQDRGFTEVDLRAMLHTATSWRPDHVTGRYLIATRLRARPWSVIVEPDPDEKLLVVITAFPIEDTP